MNHLETLNEYIDTHFNGNKTEREARIAFRDYRDGVLSSIPDMDAEFLKEQPACVAVGFLGKLDFTEGANLEKFIANPNRETLTVLRKNGLSGLPIALLTRGGIWLPRTKRRPALCWSSASAPASIGMSPPSRPPSLRHPNPLPI
jgi:hypothetical protein